MARPPHYAEELLLKDRARLRALARGLVGEADADDVVQDAWLLAARQPPSRPDNPEGWLYAVTRNLALRRKRSTERRRSWERYAARRDRVPSASEEAEAIELRRRLLDAVEGLEEPFRQTIILRYLEGLPPRAIAKQQSIPVKTVKSRLSRGLERLRHQLDRVFGSRRMWLIPFGVVAFAREASAATSLAPALGWGGIVMSAKKAVAAAFLLVVGLWLGARVLGVGSSPDRLNEVPVEELSAESPTLRGSHEMFAPRAAGLHAEVPHTSFTGRVVDPRGRGVPNADVRVFFDQGQLDGQLRGGISNAMRSAQDEYEQPTTRTDGEGEFRLDRPFSSIGFLRVRAPGYSIAVVRANSGTHVTVEVRPSEALRVRVLDPEGLAVKGASVRLVTPDSAPPFDIGHPQRVIVETLTDAEGRADLPVVRDEPGMSVEVAPREPELGLRIESVASGVDAIDVHVSRVRVVERQVLDSATRRPVDGAYVDVLSSGGSGFSWSTQRARRRFFADTQGFVRFPHQEGYYAEVVTAPGYFVGDVWQEPVMLQRGMRISGSVLDERGQPLAGAAVLVAVGNEVFGRMQLGMSPAAAWTDATGSFVVDLKLPWSSHGKPPPDLGLRSVVAVHPDHAPAIVEGLVVTPGAERDVTLRCPEPSALEVRLVDPDGRGIPDAYVLVTRPVPVASTWPVADGPLLGLSLHSLFEPRLAKTDANGQYRVERLPPGRHLVRIENLAEEIVVEEGQMYRVKMVRGLGHSVRVRLINADGAPVAGSQVFLAGPSSGNGTTDTEGRFVFEDLSPGDYQVTCVLRFPRGTILWRMPVEFDSETTLRVPAGPAQLRVHAAGPAPGTAVEYMVATDNGGSAPGQGWGLLESNQETQIFTPGAGVLFVRANGYGWAMKAFEAPAARATDVQVTLVPSGEVRGRYTGPRSSSLLVRLRRTDVSVPQASGPLQHAIDAAGVEFQYATLDEQGRFGLPDVVPGTYEVSVGHAKDPPWKPQAVVQVTVASGEMAEIELAP